MKIFDTDYNIVETIETKECPFIAGEGRLYVVGVCAKKILYIIVLLMKISSPQHKFITQSVLYSDS